jgi:exosortase
MSSPVSNESAPPSFAEVAADTVAWFRRDPLNGILLLVIAGVVAYFFGFYNVFNNGRQSVALWAWAGWNEENDQEHCRFILPIIAFILWYRRADLQAAVKAPGASEEPRGRGLAFVITGVIMFVLGARCLQPRLAIVSLPLIVYGMAEYLGGRQVARVFIFPSLLMLFMVPIGGVIQGTVSLQLFASNTVGVLCSLLGIKVQVIGTTIMLNGHGFEVAGGCSGIRSLMAMTMLASLYVYFFMHGLIRQLIVFAGSVIFALIGNIARLSSIVFVARFWDPKIAGDQYHDWSDYVFFPCAVLAMVSFSNLVNRDWSGASSRIARTLKAPDVTPMPEAEAPPEGEREGEREQKSASPISYDY